MKPQRPVGTRCQATTQAGEACPTPALRKADQDGIFRCVQHSIRPEVAAAIKLSRSRGGLNTSGQTPREVHFERYQTAERLDELFDEGLSVLRSELRARRADKPRVTAAIAQLADAKIKLKSLEFTARALGRLKPGQLPEQTA